MAKEPTEDHYDAIVIGGGLGGLTAAAWLAKAGRKVLVVEKEPRVGGYFDSVVHGSHSFNNGPRLLMGCHADGPYGPGVTHRLLEQLGVRQACEFIPVQPFTTVRTPDLEYKFWSGREAFVRGLNSASPGGLEGVPELLDLCGRIHQAGLSYYAAKRPWGLARVAGPLIEALPYQSACMERVLGRYLPQSRPRSIVGSLWPFLGLPPWRASFIYWAILMATYIDEGAYFCRGGLHQLPQAVASALRRDGGDLLAGTAVRRILVNGRRVRGVEVADGRQFFAPTVIANIDPRQVLGELIEPELRPQRYLRRLGRMELSVRGLTLSLVTDLDLPRLGFGYETLILDSLDTKQLWQGLEAGRTSVFSLTVMNAADPGLAPPGQHLVNIFCSLPLDYDPSPANIRRAAAELLAAAERHAPGLQDHLLLAHSGEVPEGFLARVSEPIYGWSLLPRHTGLLRLDPHTPVGGLTLAGQWTRPGQGTTGVILSGLEAAAGVLR